MIGQHAVRSGSSVHRRRCSERDDARQGAVAPPPSRPRVSLRPRPHGDVPSELLPPRAPICNDSRLRCSLTRTLLVFKRRTRAGEQESCRFGPRLAFGRAGCSHSIDARSGRSYALFAHGRIMHALPQQDCLRDRRGRLGQPARPDLCAIRNGHRDWHRSRRKAGDQPCSARSSASSPNISAMAFTAASGWAHGRRSRTITDTDWTCLMH